MEKPDNTSFFVAGGTLRPDVPSYVTRPTDEDLFRLALNGELCYVLTPRQMGKSSLMVRTAKRLHEYGVQTAIVDLTRIGTGVNIEQWYQSLLSQLKRRLRLDVDAIEWWHARDSLAYVQRFTDFLRDVVLDQIEGQVVIFIDEIDVTLGLGFRDDFFAAIRAVYNAQANEPEFQRLTFVLLGVASPSDLIRANALTPFNIGHQLPLQEFSKADAAVLREGLVAVHPIQGKAMFDRIYYWTNGHPYLTQKLCLAAAEEPDRDWADDQIDRLVERIFLSEEARKETNLQFVQKRILSHPLHRELLVLYNRIVRGRIVRDEEQSPVQSELKLSGLVRREKNILKVRNRIYSRAFNRHWIRDHWPDNWFDIIPTEVKALGITGLLLAIIIVLSGFVWTWRGQAKALRREIDTRSTVEANLEAAQATVSEELVIRTAREADANRYALAAGNAHATAVAELAIRTEAQADALALAKTRESQASKLRSQANTLQSLDLAESAQQALGVQQPDLALALAVRASDLVESPSHQAHAALVKALYASTIRHRFEHGAPVSSLALSPDGYLALSGGRDGSLVLWNLVRLHRLADRPFQGHTDTVWDIAFGPDRDTALSASGDGTLLLWDVDTGAAIRRFEGHTGDVYSVAFSPDGRTALSGGRDQMAILWDVETGQEVRRFTGHADRVWSVAFSPDGRRALSGDDGGSLILWNVETGRAIRRLEGHRDGVTDVVFTLDGEQALSGSFDDTLILWDVESGAKNRVFAGYAGSVYGVGISSDGRTVVSANEQGNSLTVWDAESGAQVRHFEGHTGWVRAIALSPDGQTLLSGSDDESVVLWAVESGESIRRLGESQGPVHTSPVYAVALSPDGRTALSGSEDGSLILWDIESGEATRLFEGQTLAVSSVTFSPDGRTALSSSFEGDLVLWDVESRTAVRHLGRVSDWLVFNAAFSPDGSMVLASAEGERLRLWDVSTGQAIRDFVGHDGQVYGVAFSPDGTTALSSDESGILILWDVESGKVLHRMDTEAYDVYRVAYSPDGRTALSGSGEGRLTLWNLEAGEAIRHLDGHGDTVFGVAFSPDGRTALSSAWDGSLILWDMGSGAELRRYEALDYPLFEVAFGPNGRFAIAGSGGGDLILLDLSERGGIRRIGEQDAVNSVAFDPADRTLLSGQSDGTLVLWDVSTGKEIQRYEGHTGAVYDVAFSPDGGEALSASADGSLILWDVATGDKIDQLEGHTDDVLAVAFHPDGHTALSGSVDEDLIVWDVDKCEVLYRFDDHGSDVYTVAFSPDGSVAASGAQDGSLILWDTANWTLLYNLEGHLIGLRDLAFSPDGSTLLSGSIEDGLVLWDVATGQVINRFEEYAGRVSSVAWSLSKVFALSASHDGYLILWDARTGKVVYRFEDRPAAVTDIAFGSGGDMAVSSAADGSIELWRIYASDDLATWTRANRYVRELTCSEQQKYMLEPSCTPVPTPTPTPSPPITATPAVGGIIRLGDNHGQISIGGSQVWYYTGRVREILTIQATADRPASGAPIHERIARELLDLTLSVMTLDGSVLAQADDIERYENTDSLIQGLVLPESGNYQIVVGSFESRTGGAYTLTLSREARTQTGVIAFGERVTATVSSGARHLWTFQGTQGQIVTVAMSAVDDQLDAYLVLLGPDGEILAENDDYGDSTDSRIEHVWLPGTGTYMIVARGFGDSAGTYTLELYHENGSK